MKVGISSNICGMGIWYLGCEFCDVGVIVLEICGGGKVFRELGRFLFVEDCCVRLEFVLVRLYDNGLVNMGCNVGLERCPEVV